MLRLLYRIMERIDGERGISLISYRLASPVKWWCLSYMDLEEKAIPLTISAITVLFTLFLMAPSMLALPEGVVDIGRGGLDYGAQIARFDEAGKLSDSFNNTEDGLKNIVLPISNLEKEFSFQEKSKRLNKFLQNIENLIFENYRKSIFQKTTKDFFPKNKNISKTFFQKNIKNIENFFPKNILTTLFRKA